MAPRRARVHAIERHPRDGQCVARVSEHLAQFLL
jgi:hypothetical protein